MHSLRRGFLTSLAPGRAPGLALLLLLRVQLRQPLRSSLGPLPLLLPMGAQPLRDLRPPIRTIAVGAVRTAGTARTPGTSPAAADAAAAGGLVGPDSSGDRHPRRAAAARRDSSA